MFRKFLPIILTVLLCLSMPQCEAREVLYSLASDQVYQSNDGGTSWTGLYIESASVIHYNELVLDSAARIVYIASGSGLLKGTQSGTKWEKIYPLGSHESFNSLCVSVDDPSCIYATTVLNLYISADRGKTWNQAPVPQREIYFIAAFSRQKKIYVAGNNRIFRSLDNGKSWTLITSNLPGGSYIEDMAVNPADSREIYLCTPEGFYRSTDGGARWWPRKTSTKGWIVPSRVLFHPGNPRTLYVLSQDRKQGGGAFLRMSRDGGVNWKTIASKEEIRTFGVHPSDSLIIYYLGYSTTEMSGTETMFKNIYATANGGGSWKELKGILPGTEQIKKIIVRPW